MNQKSISLYSLLETHELPFVVIDSSLTIVAINKAWEVSFAANKEDSIGLPCCENSPDCRHYQLFQNLEPYEEMNVEQTSQQVVVKGYPLLDSSGQIFLGESVTHIMPKSTTEDSGRMVGKSSRFNQFKHQLLKASNSSIPVFLQGETGSGKELAAEFIHLNSAQNQNQYVIVDCTILSEDLFESELFGHVKGAFTGANQNKKGLFELADQGTLFLDEIGELPLSLQPKLLRALETGQFRPVGGTESSTSQVRVISATHRNLADMVKKGLFREDLFYRLSVFAIQVPSLRERIDDLPVLIDLILKQLGQREGRQYQLEKSALIKLLKHPWPGNIRELKNCIQLAASISPHQRITEDEVHFMNRLNEEQVISDTGINNIQQVQENPLLQVESDLIQNLLKKHNGSRKQVAAEMNISERTLYRKLKRLELN